MDARDRFKSLAELALIAALFVAASYFAQRYVDDIRDMLGSGAAGMFLYFFVTVVSVVVAPISVLPLVPVAAHLWGWPTAGLLNIVSWTTGGAMAFALARRYGVPIIQRLVPIDRVHRLECYIPQGNVFWSIVLLRMGMPFDLLSYALGLFSRIGFSRYLLATVIGATPVAFALAYLGTVSILWQLIAIFLAAGVLALGWSASRKRAAEEETKNDQAD